MQMQQSIAVKINCSERMVKMEKPHFACFFRKKLQRALFCKGQQPC